MCNREAKVQNIGSHLRFHRSLFIWFVYAEPQNMETQRLLKVLLSSTADLTELVFFFFPSKKAFYFVIVESYV